MWMIVPQRALGGGSGKSDQLTTARTLQRDRLASTRTTTRERSWAAECSPTRTWSRCDHGARYLRDLFSIDTIIVPTMELGTLWFLTLVIDTVH